MNSFYEHNQDTQKSLYLTKGKFFIYPAHFHHKVELFILKKGNVDITCNGKVFKLNDGCIAFFNSYDVHSYDVQLYPADAFCLIIPPELAVRFLERSKGKILKNHVIEDVALCNEIYSLTQTYIENQTSEYVKFNCIELILSLLESRFEFSSVNNYDDTTTLVQKILIYINDNFKGDVSLKTISKKLGYSNAHISRAFGRYLKKSIPDYVNELRLKEVKRLTSESDTNVTELIFQAGFKSLQTYYRFKKQKEKTTQ